MENNEKDRPSPGNPGDKLILIVDADETISDWLYYIVSKEGFKIEQAADGEEALDKARLLRPGLILLDPMLPKSGGIEILRKLQEDDTTGIPVVIVSGRRLDRDTLETLKREPNVEDFVDKLVRPEVLAALLHDLLKTRPAVKGESRGK
ncbi:MAG: response regulator [Elusimicrobiota bacterium]|nr:response regulator [Elusimicrobiota bacterium]